jgi:hypothetical protein
VREELSGGYRSAARRDGNTVRRAATSQYAIDLLEFLANQGWQYSPAVISTSSMELVLAYVEGTAAIATEERSHAAQDDALAKVARIVRELHDLTAGSVFARGAEVACHNDLDPRNTVYRRGRGGLVPIALIDWDLAGPGQRVHDLAHLCWTYTGMHPQADPEVISNRIRVCLSAYSWTGTGGEVVDAMLWWQDRCWRGIQAEADSGDPGMQALVDTGVMDRVRADYSWTAQNLHDLRTR